MKTKEKILHVALDLFNEKGTQSVSTNHIAEAAGISPGNLYYHYRNKEEIIILLFENMVAEFNKCSCPGSVPGEGEISFEALDIYLQHCLETEWKYRFLKKELLALIGENEQLQNLFYETQKHHVTDIEASVRAYVSAGLLKPMDDVKIVRLTRAIWINAVFWLPFLDSSGKELTRESVEEGIAMIRFLLEPYMLN